MQSPMPFGIGFSDKYPLSHMRRRKRLPRARAVAGVIGELHGVNRPGFNAEPLQCEVRRIVANVPSDDARLN